MMELPTKRPSYEKYDEVTGELITNADGSEVNSGIPMAPPVGYQKPVSMFDQMRMQIRAEHQRLRQLEEEGLYESVEESNDFEVDEDIENQPSLYEEKYDPVDYEARQRLRQAEFSDSVRKRQEELAPKPKGELLDGRNEPDERRNRDRDIRSEQSRAERESYSEPVYKSSDERSARQVDERSKSTKSKDP